MVTAAKTPTRTINFSRGTGSPVQDGQQFIRQKDAARLLGCTRHFLRELGLRGKLQASRVGGLTFYELDDIYRLMRESRIVQDV